MLKLMLITNRPERAALACRAGVDRIFVDLEILGKPERQGHRNTVISGHSVADIIGVRRVVPPGRLLVRTNPLHAESGLEIDASIAAGADFLMLPMFRARHEVERYCHLVAGRRPVIALLETSDAVEQAASIATVPGVTELFVGLNDLHLDMGLPFIFDVITEGVVERVAGIARTAGIPFGFGGVARLDEGLVPGRLIAAEHYRLGSSAVILSRTFMRDGNGEQFEEGFVCALAALRRREETLGRRVPAEVEQDHAELLKRIQHASLRAS